MVRHRPKLWVLVADGEHARVVVRGHKAGAFRTELKWQSDAMHLRSSDLGSDQPGRSFESAGPARHAIAPKHDLRQLEKTKFLHAVADKVNAAAAEGGFDHLLLVAPTRAMHDLRERLDHVASAKLVGSLEKDLTKVPDQDLGEHLAYWGATGGGVK